MTALELDEPIRGAMTAMLVAVSLASAVVVLFVHWFVNKYIAPRAVTNNTFVSSTASGAADAAGVEAAFARQQQAIARLETRILDLEGALRDLKVRLHEPQVPVTYQASPSSRSARFGDDR